MSTKSLLKRVKEKLFKKKEDTVEKWDGDGMIVSVDYGSKKQEKDAKDDEDKKWDKDGMIVSVETHPFKKKGRH